MNQSNARIHFHAYANSCIVILFLEEFGSNHACCSFITTAKTKFLLLTLIVSFNRTCFMTVFCSKKVLKNLKCMWLF